VSDPKSLIAAAYDRAAPDFAEFAARLVYRHLSVPLVERLRSIDGLLLDVAGGTGALAHQVERVLTLDISLEQLLQNPIELKVVSDAELLPFPDDAFAAAASAFGINHFPNPQAAVDEMARVAPVVGLLTWARPEDHYEPKQIVLDVVERHAGRFRTEAGDLIDEMTNATGSIAAVTGLLEGAGLHPEVEEIVVEVPWPGVEGFVDYRVSSTGVTEMIDDLAAARAEAIAEIEALPEPELKWQPRLVLGLGAR
jgi:ubiquinone/menaquinone biosynthesis C-methylase UbiE